MLRWLFFLIVALVQRASYRSASTSLLYGALIGVIVGPLFDIFIGTKGAVHVYYLEQTFLFLFLNGLLSYGIFFAIVHQLSQRTDRKKTLRKFYFSSRHLFASLATMSAVSLFFTPPNFLHQIELGVLLIAVGEFLLDVYGKEGPVSSLYHGDAYSFFRIWAWSIFVGLLHEVGNALFPVWQWKQTIFHSLLADSVLMGIFGYFVLFHVGLTVFKLFQKHTT